MKTLYYDGTFPGFIYAAGETGCFRHSHPGGHIRLIGCTEKQPELASVRKTLTTDINAARIYYRAFRQKAGSCAAGMLRLAFLSEKRGREEVLLSFLQKALHYGPAVSKMLADPDIKTVSEWNTSVGREKNRYMGILRFHEAAPGLYRADFAPRYNICRMLAEHFTLRMHDLFWIIVDNERQLAIFHRPENNALAIIRGREQINRISPVAGTCEDYALLWQDYFETMEIRERKNSRCQAGFIPKRDRTHMTEFLKKQDTGRIFGDINRTKPC
ncbi:MAG: TIGR03915 family putative DNA repair protein [Spirochaetales bacterium]|nr:TIGR03915 family putative DNA repair protein [Spirochaetales bacterium]